MGVISFLNCYRKNAHFFTGKKNIFKILCGYSFWEDIFLEIYQRKALEGTPECGAPSKKRKRVEDVGITDALM